VIVAEWDKALGDRKADVVVLDLRQQFRLQSDLYALAALAERAYPGHGSRPTGGPQGGSA
jgi:hypothetical protein